QKEMAKPSRDTKTISTTKKFATQAVDGKWWYADTADEANYAKWYYDRRARGIPNGQPPFDMPARVTSQRVKWSSGVSGSYYVSDSGDPAAPPPIPTPQVPTSYAGVIP